MSYRAAGCHGIESRGKCIQIGAPCTTSGAFLCPLRPFDSGTHVVDHYDCTQVKRHGMLAI